MQKMVGIKIGRQKISSRANHWFNSTTAAEYFGIDYPEPILRKAKPACVMT
jgi:hypothetical protein